MVATVTSLRSGDMAVRTVEQPLGTGEQFSVNDIALGVGYGLQITDRVSAGLQINLAQETIWQSPMLAVYPGLLILITVAACNMLGDELQAAFDPRRRLRTA